jgi:DNA repair protein RadD
MANRHGDDPQRHARRHATSALAIGCHMSAPELRPYQIKAVEDFTREIAAGRRRTMLVMPTGGGKTVVAAAIIKQFVDAFKSVLVLAHRREIVTQTADKLRDQRISYGIIQAGTSPRPLERVQVASIQTLHRRAIHAEKMDLPPADLLWIDESHHTPARTYKQIIDAYPNTILLGTTATPCRGDGRGLGSIFEVIIEAPQVADLITQGYLVSTKVYAPTNPDLRGVRTQAGDYVETQLAERMDRPKLVGDIVTHWHKFSERRRTVCFAVSVGHSIHIRDEFIKSGVRAEHIDGTTPKPERDASLARLASGEIELISNCMVLTEGWDLPEVACCVLARPTKKMGLYRQMIGRVLRPADGKPNAIVLDHSGAVFRHGFVEDRVEWTLDPDRHAESPQHQQRCEEHGSRLLECTNCGAMRVAGEPCAHCGFLPQRSPRAIELADGDLGLVDGQRRVNGKTYSDVERERWHAMLIWIGQERDYKAGWAAHKYRDKFGVLPAWGAAPEPFPPSAEVRSWVRSRNIAFARRQVA